MTYNGGNNSNKANGRHSSSYSGGHHGGPNHHHQHSNSSQQQQQQQQNVAMAAFMNQSAMAAALMNPYALANLRTSSGPHHQHLHQQSSHGYYGFPSFPSVIDPSIRSYYQQSSQNAQSQQAHAVSSSKEPCNRVLLKFETTKDRFLSWVILTLFYHHSWRALLRQASRTRLSL